MRFVERLFLLFRVVEVREFTLERHPSQVLETLAGLASKDEPPTIWNILKNFRDHKLWRFDGASFEVTGSRSLHEFCFRGEVTEADCMTRVRIRSSYNEHFARFLVAIPFLAMAAIVVCLLTLDPTHHCQMSGLLAGCLGVLIVACLLSLLGLFLVGTFAESCRADDFIALFSELSG